MDDKTTPLTVLKRRTLYTSPSKYRLGSSSSSLSSLSYPQIPSRRSSLFANVESDSSELPTSTRTPSLSDSLYNIDVAKIRHNHTDDSLDIRKTGLDLKEDPFVDHTPWRHVDHRAHMTQSRCRLAPQLLVRWSSGSYGAMEPCLSSKSTSFSSTEPPVGLVSDQKPTADSVQSLSNVHRGFSALLSPLDLPVAFVSIRSYAGWPSVAKGSMSVWASVVVSADVEPISLPETSTLAPLDMIILFDNLQQPSVSGLTSMVLASSVLTSNLVPNRDRIAIACIDGSEKDGVGLLLPLGFHSFEASRTALNTFSLRQLQKKLKRSSDTGKSIRRVSQLFCRSPRAAFCHLVFISANPPENLCISGVDPAIGFHTMSSELSFPIQTATRPLGWHIYYDATADDPHSSEVHFMRKVSKVVRQLRTGLNPGVISQLRLFFDQGYGCQFESAMEDSRLAYLRPGETWILKVRIGVPIETYQKAQFTGHPMLEEMISEIDSVLEVYSPGPTAQHVFSARLEYQHSLLPTPHAVCLETHCTISHIPGVPLGAPGDDNKIPRLASYELDDEAISISLGSASESS